MELYIIGSLELWSMIYRKRLLTMHQLIIIVPFISIQIRTSLIVYLDLIWSYLAVGNGSLVSSHTCLTI